MHAYCEASIGSQEQKTAVVAGFLNPPLLIMFGLPGCNPHWNASMQFLVKDLQQDILCLTVFDRDFFSPNEFLGRSELRVADIIAGCEERRGPVIFWSVMKGNNKEWFRNPDHWIDPLGVLAWKNPLPPVGVPHPLGASNYNLNRWRRPWSCWRQTLGFSPLKWTFNCSNRTLTHPWDFMFVAKLFCQYIFTSILNAIYVY